MRPESRQSCVARLLDVRGFVLAVRAATAQAEPASAMIMVILFGTIALCLLPLWISFDLNSTWDFTTALREGAEPVIASAASEASGVLSITVAAAVAGFILTSFTLLPTLFELAFPTVAHPLLSIALWASLIFDYTTDWGKSWQITAIWAGDNNVVHFVYTAVACLFFSVIVQALLVICLTAVFFGGLALLGGGARQAAVIVER